MTRRSSLRLCAFLVVFATPAAADEVSWRHDYQQARLEASTRNVPLLVDFGTRNCFWCRKLDASTFRDTTVVGVLNRDFVPLKIDAQREPALTRALQIESFPTLILATPDGSVVDRVVGYTSADRLHQQLQQTLAWHRRAESMRRDYQDAVKAVAVREYPTALRLLRQVTADQGRHVVQDDARRELERLERQADEQLIRVRHLQQAGQEQQASVVWADLLRNYPDTRAASTGKTSLSSDAPRR